MRALEASRTGFREPIRILFYGQSIMGGQWHVHVEAALRARYPEADLRIENRAIGGFSAKYLIRTCEADLYPFQPDLFILHVYGHHVEYENILRQVRARTTAEIMIMTDHWTRKDYDPLHGYRMNRWGAFMEQHLAQLCEKYRCERVDVRQGWRAWLETAGKTPTDLLKDNVHLNDAGKEVMAAICLRHFLPHPEPELEAGGQLIEIPLDSLRQASNRFALDFHGHRVDLVPRHHGQGRFRIRIDGQPPATYPGLFAFTRTSSIIRPGWPTLMRVESAALPVVEDWTLTLTEVAPDQSAVRFRLEGSRTGFDGEGSNAERFVSNSGRVVLEPGDWTILRSYRLRGEPAEPGMQVTWRCEAQFQEDGEWEWGETPWMLFHGLGPGEHRLEVESEPGVLDAMEAVRVFRPASHDWSLLRDDGRSPLMEREWEEPDQG